MPDAGAPTAILTVDLDAVVENHRRLRARAGVEVAGVVKADGYGLGAARIAAALAGAGCRAFFVASLDEGVALRAALPDGAIHVLNGVAAGEEARFRSLRLVPVLNDPGQARRWRDAARAQGAALPAALHFDTGMSRLGFTRAEALALAAQADALAGLDLRLVLSHMVVSEEPDHALNRTQLERFRALRAHWPAAKASFGNSSAVFLGPDYVFDLVRPGAATVGINPVPGRPNPMLAVARLQARVLQVREIDAPETVGYGATWQATGRTRIATIGCGYADGWLRALGNRGCAVHAGRRLPFAGRVSMDLITLDASSAPDLAAGDLVDLIGPDLPVDEVAEQAGTNAYEVLVRIGTRVARRYCGQAAS